MSKESLHPHFPCEGTPAHEGTCDEPQPYEAEAWREVQNGLQASHADFREWLQRAFDVSPQPDDQPADKFAVKPAVPGPVLQPANDGQRPVLVVPSPSSSGVFLAVNGDDLFELDLDDPRRSWAV